MSTSEDLKAIFAAGRPLVGQALDIAEQIAALRDAATEKGLDWSQVKALLKAQIQDERDGSDGKRVRKIVEKADFATAYAEMLGLANMNENIFSAEPHDPDTGEIIEPQASVSRPAQAEEDRASAKSSSAAPIQEPTGGTPRQSAPGQAGEDASVRIATGRVLPADNDLELPAFLDRRGRAA